MVTFSAISGAISIKMLRAGIRTPTHSSTPGQESGAGGVGVRGHSREERNLMNGPSPQPSPLNTNTGEKELTHRVFAYVLS